MICWYDIKHIIIDSGCFCCWTGLLPYPGLAIQGFAVPCAVHFYKTNACFWHIFVAQFHLLLPSSSSANEEASNSLPIHAVGSPAGSAAGAKNRRRRARL